MGLDALLPVQVVDGDLAKEAFQQDENLLFESVLTTGSRSDSSNEGSGSGRSSAASAMSVSDSAPSVSD